MGDTYDSFSEAEADRTQQRELLAALGAWDRGLRRDECGAWCISGQRGAIRTFGDGKSWVVHVVCRSVRHWTATKERLSFCELMQDGDDEGCLRLIDLPTPDQAIAIRDVIGLRKRTELGPAELERRRGLGKLLSQAQRLPSLPTLLPTPAQPSQPDLEFLIGDP
jgi:hypothetical protein